MSDYKTAVDLFGAVRVLQNKKGIGGGERGALLRYFCEKLNPGRIDKKYAPLDERAIIRILPYMNDIRSLFWLKSICEDSERRGYSFSKKFWWIAKQQARAEDVVV